MRTRIGGDPNTLNYLVEIGPFGDSDANAEPETAGPTGGAAEDHEHDIIDDSLTTQVETLASVDDDILATSGDRHAGQEVYFVNTVKNIGGTADTFNITTTNVSFPPGYVVQLYKSDGITPLGDTNTDGIPDTGTLAINEEYNVVVKVTIPGDAVAGGPYNRTITATSAGDPTKSNTTTDRIQSVLTAAVDIAENDGDPIGDTTGDNDLTDDTPTPQNPGCPTPDYYDFPIEIQNVFASGTETGAPDTYNLTVTDTLATWSYKIYEDLDADGVLDDDELVEISDTGYLNPGESIGVIVRITPPDGVSNEIYTPDLVATSTQNEAISDAVEMSVAVATCKHIIIEPDNNRTSVAGGVVTYKHVVTNLGNTTEQWNLSYSSTENYNAVFVTAAGATIGETATISAGGDYLATNDGTTNSLDPAESVDIYIKVFVPTNAPVGSLDINTVTVVDAAPSVEANGTDAAVDITTIIDGNLELTKVVDKATASPTATTATVLADFDPLKYITTYKNLGATALANTYIIDAIPANTRIVIATDAPDEVTAPSGGTAIQYSTDGGITWGAAPAASADHSAPTVTHIRWTIIDPLPSGASGTVTFEVLID